MNSKLIGIAGGSGSGKSTVAINLCKKYPGKFSLIHLDDYFKRSWEAPKQGEFINFDHPDSLRFDDLRKDLLSLKKGEPVTILTKSELYNPEYDNNLKNKIEYIVEPKEFTILEGYLALHDQKICELMDCKIYLDIPLRDSTKRRSANKFALDNDYLEQVLEPMYKEFVLPTKFKADLVIDVFDKEPEEVLDLVETAVFQSVSEENASRAPETRSNP